MLNIYIYCLEDDEQLRSAFSMDIGRFTHNIKPNVNVFARYRPYNYFFHTDITIQNNKIKWTPLKQETYAKGFIAQDIHLFLKKYQKTDGQNIFIIQSHGYDYYVEIKDKCTIDTPACVSDKMYLPDFADGLKYKMFDAIIIDACCNSTYATMKSLENVTKYVVACQQSSPYLGFVSEKFVDIISNETIGFQTRLKHICDAFIERNRCKDNKWNGLRGPTDAAIIDMAEFSNFRNDFDRRNITFSRKAKFRVISEYDYYVYDMTNLLKDRKELTLTSLLTKSIKYYVKTSKKKGNTNGLSIEIRYRPAKIVRVTKADMKK
jgi:hypothetical protein